MTEARDKITALQRLKSQTTNMAEWKRLNDELNQACAAAFLAGALVWKEEERE